MLPLAAGLWALLGLLVAGPLNHLADRLPRHSKLRPRPACPYCGQPYHPVQWLALAAWLTGNGRCRACSAALRPRRWLLEAGLAALYGALAWRFGLSWKLGIATFHASALALIVVTDLEERTVPEAVVIVGAALTVVTTILLHPSALPSVLLGGGLAFLAFLLLTLYPRGMGFGDVTLAGYVGLIAGYPHFLGCLLVAVLAGGLGAAILLVSGRVSRRSYIPYAPFLALGGALAILLL